MFDLLNTVSRVFLEVLECVIGWVGGFEVLGRGRRGSGSGFGVVISA